MTERKLRPELLDAAVQRVDAAVADYLDTRHAAPRETKLRWRMAEESTLLVAELTELRNSSADALDYVIGEARRRGASWAVLGRALGLTKQGAAQKYGKGVTRL